MAFELGVVGSFEEFAEKGAGAQACGCKVVAGEEGWWGVILGGERGEVGEQHGELGEEAAGGLERVEERECAGGGGGGEKAALASKGRGVGRGEQGVGPGEDRGEQGRFFVGEAEGLA